MATTTVAVRRSMTAREFLTTSEGQALLAQPGTQFFGSIGSILDMIDMIEKLIGSGGSMPGIDLEELLADYERMLRELLDGQRGIRDGIDRIGRDIGGIDTDLDELKDLIERANAGDEAAMQLLRQILYEQRKYAEELKRQLAGIGNQLDHMWADMGAWFGQTLHGLDGLSRAMALVLHRLAAIEAMLRAVLAELAELHDRVDWIAVVGMTSEAEMRIGHHSVAMLEVHVTPEEPATDSANGDEPEPPRLAVDSDELRRWAQSAADENDGLPFALYALHRALVGDTVLGKPMMDVFCRLLAHDRRATYLDAGSYYTKLAATQAQGVAMLGKARQVLSLPSADLASLLQERFVAQTAAVKASLEEVYGTSEWNNFNPLDPMAGTALRYADITTEEKPTRYFVVRDNREVLSSMSLEPVGGAGGFYVGTPVPGTWSVDPDSVEKRTAFADGRAYASNAEFFMRTGGLVGRAYSHHMRCYSHPYIFEPEYALVGLKFSTVEKALLCEPLVARYDPETGTTSFDGRSGGIWKATSDAELRPVELWFGETTTEPVPTTALKTRRYARSPSEISPKIIRGFRFFFEQRALGPHRAHETWAAFGYLDGNFEEQTMIPNDPPSTDLTYEPVRLP
ncbi:hypothetical protein [Conexibacter woesei]|uniref:Uncharacterized protein n=1 Tax=Conexibacter woesei (strain DSM 14684 / CCUG 47730 / CIP 108061 / JCM 11494 / NBRC 100937 / ID131577) TaxID=469383 RepID=D3FCQ0_CONWI|nr:hypothetical protein [Conexibacter woesei]ADB49523.1 hypothetical protein Cwoe_1091 [Conexibacter woesei DSM 14684]